MKQDLSRRSFMKFLGLALAALVTSSALFRKTAIAAAKEKAPAALPAGQVEVPATDAVANAIGYKKNVKDVDFKKYPQRKKPEAKSQFCKNCALYTPSNDGWGKCSMITSGLVTAEGWCASWNKKS